MPKKRGVEGAVERLRALLAQVEEAVERVTEEVERDEGEDDARPTLADLYTATSDLVAKAEGLLERARGVVAVVEKRAESGAEFVSAFEDLVGGLDSASEALNPDNWEWGEGDEGGARG